MPTYNYKCPVCNLVKEIKHSIKENPKIKCTICGGKMFIIIMNTPSILFVDNINKPVTWERKNNRYFNNAELERVKKLKKKKDRLKEESFYGGHAKDMLKKGVVK